MRKLAAILLLAMLVFNWCGYRLIISYRENKASAQLEAQLDDNKYDESQLISFKVPTEHLAYYNSSLSFTRMDGQVTIGGIQYRYVERRILNDSMEFLCIPDYAAMKLNKAGDDFCKKTGSHPGTSKIFTADYYTSSESFELKDSYIILAKRPFHYLMPHLSSWAADPAQPPEPIS